MLSFAGSLKVFVAVAPCDMRKSFNGLSAGVTERLGSSEGGEIDASSRVGMKAESSLRSPKGGHEPPDVGGYVFRGGYHE